MILPAILIVLVWLLILMGGILSLLNPRLMWKMSEGWKYKNLEPSNARLVTIQVKGLFLLALAGGSLLFLYSLLQSRP